MNKSVIRVFYVLLAAYVFAISFTACKDSIINIFPESEDVKLGSELSAQIRSNNQEYPIFNGDPSIKAYIKSQIFDNILNSPNIQKRSSFQYEIEIINAPDVLNAFALPGGKIFVYTGLLKYLDSEAALAGVIGHEIAHAERRHATQRMTEAYGVDFLLSLVLGENATELAKLVANLFTGALFLANSRAQEDDSDDYSVKYLQGTRYYPGAVKFFFEKMRDEGLVSSQSNKIKSFLSTHPDPVDRIAAANSRLQSSGISVYSHGDDQTSFYKSEYEANVRSKLP